MERLRDELSTSDFKIVQAAENNFLTCMKKINGSQWNLLSDKKGVKSFYDMSVVLFSTLNTLSGSFFSSLVIF